MSSSSSDSSSEGEPDWDFLQEELDADAFAALKAHFDTKEELRNEPSSSSNAMPDTCMSTLPAVNTSYASKDYWDERFSKEESYDWLLGYKELSEFLDQLPLGKQSRILLVGCGNSSLTIDMHKAGYDSLLSTDYSAVVIEAMRKKHGSLPGLQWEVMDMLDLTYPSSSFDVVLDKAALDAFHTGEGDIWNPSDDVVQATHRMCSGIATVLRPGGIFLQISIAQPHFRLPYLTGKHAGADYGWSCAVQEIAGFSMPHFCYTMTKAQFDAEQTAVRPAEAAGNKGVD